MVNKKIKKILIDKDMTIVDLARMTSYTRIHISKIINGHVKSLKAEKLIAFTLGYKHKELFECNNN